MNKARNALVAFFGMLGSLWESVVSIVTKPFAILAALMTMAFTRVYATVPAEITTALEDAGDVWDDVKSFVIGVVIFLVLLGIFKLIRRK